MTISFGGSRRVCSRKLRQIGCERSVMTAMMATRGSRKLTFTKQNILHCISLTPSHALSLLPPAAAIASCRQLTLKKSQTQSSLFFRAFFELFFVSNIYFILSQVYYIHTLPFFLPLKNETSKVFQLFRRRRTSTKGLFGVRARVQL